MYNLYNLDDYLSHSGVKGMHWGQRKQEEEMDPELSNKAVAYMKNFKTFKKLKALYVCGKATKAEVEAAKEKARSSAMDYRRHYFSLKSRRQDETESMTSVNNYLSKYKSSV